MNKKEEYFGRFIIHELNKIPFYFKNGIKHEITYDIAYRLPKFIFSEVYKFIYNKIK